MCEIAEVYEIEKRKARKDHRCEECRGAIKAGEIYCYHHGVFDGAGFSHKVCVDCEQIRTELNKELDTYDQVCVGEICDAVFEGDDAGIKRYIEIKIKRGCPVQSWMTERLAESSNGTSSPTPDQKTL
jgi:hypothetical protein